MSNLVKSYNVVREKETKRIIDSNQAVSDAIVKIKEQVELGIDNKEEFVQGLVASNIEELLYSEDDSDGERIISGNILHSTEDGDVSPKEPEENVVKSMLASAEEQAGFIIANANGDANAIIEEAKRQAAQILENARKDGYDKGYAEGQMKAEQQISDKMNQIEAMKVALNNEFSEKCRKIEPDLVDVILKVFTDVTHVLSEDKKDLVSCLVRAVMDENVMSTSFVIRTSKEDAVYVKENKETILNDVARLSDIIIIEDSTMKKGECMVETDFGIFDCSLDVQLESLIKDIKLLACAVGNE